MFPTHYDVAIETPQSQVDKQLEAIKERAMELWGDKWMATLSKEYSRVLGDPDSYKGRYIQIQRLLEKKKCDALTLNALMMAVDCRFQMVCYSKPLIKSF